ncbi:hypothetical protein BT69DRAFT_1289858 [Atractiella rhizophila]|nr:hypothetical protein BT69DRAFT_1289858 [Atractiella rhizophila]
MEAGEEDVDLVILGMIMFIATVILRGEILRGEEGGGERTEKGAIRKKKGGLVERSIEIWLQEHQ